LDIKCRTAGLSPNAIVIVATIRALKYHGGAGLKNLTEPNPDAVEKGLPNLEKHLENAKLFNVPCVVAINKFTSDSAEEIKVVQQRCEALGVPVNVADVWGQGGAGTTDLASTVAALADGNDTPFTPLYDWEWSVEEKIRTIATKYYGAGAVEFQAKAKTDLKRISTLGMDKLPVCMAKTQKSLSDNPDLIGRPQGFTLTVREIELAAGAGFLVPITGEMMRMPGLPEVPAAEGIDIDDEGNISGLF
jgi:formate--tetrahydrofolate ligase